MGLVLGWQVFPRVLALCSLSIWSTPRPQLLQSLPVVSQWCPWSPSLTCDGTCLPRNNGLGAATLGWPTS